MNACLIEKYQFNLTHLRCELSENRSYFAVHSLDCAVNTFTDGAPYRKAAFAFEVVCLANEC